MNTQRIFDNLERVIAFEAVARLGSLHKAAGELNISQPSLSVKIKNLEETLECKFFHRSSKGVELTEKGKELLDFANQVIFLCQDLEQVLYDEESFIRGRIRLGVYESIGKYFWPGFHRYLSKAYPDLRVQLTVGRSAQLIGELLDRKIDLALTIEPPFKEELTSKEIYSDSFSFFIHPLLAKRLDLKMGKDGKFRVKTPELEKLPVINFSSALAENGKPLSEELIRLGIKTHNVTEVDSFDLALEFCLQKLGAAVLPERVAEDSFNNERIHHLKIDKLPSDRKSVV